MTEIVRMTTQQQPLEVGIPLYPFSHAGVFPKSTSARDELDNHGPGLVAPLPVSSPFDDEMSTRSSGSLSQPAMSPPIPAVEVAAWAMTDLSRGSYS